VTNTYIHFASAIQSSVLISWTHSQKSPTISCENNCFLFTKTKKLQHFTQACQHLAPNFERGRLLLFAWELAGSDFGTLFARFG
jgi:hypothetical protein